MVSFTFPLHLVPLLLLVQICLCFAAGLASGQCGEGYHLCAPAGASNRQVPGINSGMAKFYFELVETVNPKPAPALAAALPFTGVVKRIVVDNPDPGTLVCFSHGARNDSLTSDCVNKGYGCLGLLGGSFLDTIYHSREDIPDCTHKCRCPQPISQASRRDRALIHQGGQPGTLCCAETTQCLLVLSYDWPVCYDSFTTNYYLPDGSFGSIITGNYSTPSGDQANLITGNYQLKNGQSGNIYQGDTLDAPNTTNLPMPTPWTSSGIGSAIPASQVGSQAFSNSSGMPLLPSITVHTTTPGSTTSLVSNETTATTSGSPSPSNIEATATPPPPDITPPITNNGVMNNNNGTHGLWLVTVFVAVVTGLVMQ